MCAHECPPWSGWSEAGPTGGRRRSRRQLADVAGVDDGGGGASPGRCSAAGSDDCGRCGVRLKFFRKNLKKILYKINFPYS